MLEDNIINEIIDEHFEENDDLLIKVMEHFNKPDSEKPFIDVIKKVRHFIYAQPFPYTWAYKMAELYSPKVEFESSVWYKYVIDEADYLISLAKTSLLTNLNLLNQIDDEKLNASFESTFQSDAARISGYDEKIHTSWDEAADFGPLKFSNLPRTTKLDEVLANLIKANRELYKGIIKKVPSLFICKKDEYIASMANLYPLLVKLIDIVKEVDKRLMEEKIERNSYTFSDTEHFAINLLFSIEDDKIVKKELANRLSNEFEEILVDEYQDTNEAQDLLFTYLSNGRNLFTVGDIKQSIYRFRLAMPNIFNDKRKSYALYNKNDNNVSSKIILDKNFRSSKGVCDYVNFVFTHIMSEDVGEINYDKQDWLNFGANYKESDIPAAQINIIDKAKGEDKDKIEALQIAKLIKQKVKNKEQIKDGDIYRDVKYSDFAILFRSVKNHVEDYVEVLTNNSIPVVCDNSASLFESNEIKIILSYLRTIDNPTKEISLISTMMSPIYGFTADELAEIRIENNYKNFYFSLINSKMPKAIDFVNDIKNLKKLSVTMSVSNFIRYLIEEKGIVAFSNAMGNGEQRYQNILSLISFAQRFDSGVNIGLTSFIRYVDKIIDSNSSVDAKAMLSGNDNAVTIMTVHHSKGLEFPICILAGSSREYNTKELSENLLMNTKYGFGLKVHNEEMMYNIPSLPYAVIKSKSAKELMSENLRVLYVAMTRAKEQFITFFSCENLDSKINKKFVPNLIDGKITPYTVNSCSSDGELLLLCALFHKNGRVLREYSNLPILAETTQFDMSINVIEPEQYNEENIQEDETQFDEKILKDIEDKLSYKYEYLPLSTISSKMTASSLDDSDSNFEFITSSKPAFMNKAEMTPAQRGTAMHTFMQFCDYKGAKDNLEEEISRLLNYGFISNEQADCLDRRRLNSFFLSDFSKRMFKSDNIYREIKVSTFIKASDIYDVKFDNDILVQGIADCVFEEKGELVLVDYKTDRVKNENELLERYKKQIAFYSKAIEKTLKKPVKEAVLYSFYLEKVCIYK